MPEGAKTLNPELPIIRVLPTGDACVINLGLFSSPVSSSPPSKRRIINLVIRPWLGGMGDTGPYAFLLNHGKRPLNPIKKGFFLKQENFVLVVLCGQY